MGLAERVHADARDIARELGIDIVEVSGAPWLVGSSGDTVVCRAGATEPVRQARIWEGIAQCLLGRLGVPWTEGQARDLGHWLRAASSSAT